MSDYICPYNCSFRTNSGFCGYTGGYNACQYRLIAQKPKLQAVPVPPHGRLGDLDALKERVTKRLYSSNHGSMAEAYYAALIDLIDTAPTIIPAEEGK